MKILHIKINGTLNEQSNIKLRKIIEKDLEKGYLITDNVIEVEVLDVDISEVAGNRYEE